MIARAGALAFSCLAAPAALADGPKDCLEVHVAPGCEDPDCTGLVCMFRSDCCLITWDADCVDVAGAECQGCGLTIDSCFLDHAKPGCRDRECCAAVCSDPVFAYCCSEDWDFGCALRASEVCSTDEVPCGTPGSGSCTQVHGTPSCDNEACCESVCSFWPSCCDAAWDGTCVTLAFEFCMQSCNPGCPAGAATEAEPCRSLTNDPIFSPGSVPGTPQPIAAGVTVCAKLASTDDATPKNDVDVFLLDLRNADTDQDGLVRVRLRLTSGSPMFAALVPVNSAAATLAANGTLRVNGGGCQEQIARTCRAPGLWWIVVAAGSNGVVDMAPTDCTGARYQLKAEVEAACAAACGASQESCFAPHAGTSCSSATCCATTCALLPQCCDTGWDDACALTAAANCPVPPATNDACSSPREIGAGSFAFDTLGATSDGPASDPACRASSGVDAADIWFIWTPRATGDVDISTCGVDWDTRLQLFTGSCGALTLVACSDDTPFCSPSSSKGSLLYATVTCDTTYRIRVSGVEGAKGFGTLRVTAPGGPICCAADLDRSGFIDNSDIALLLLEFGPCPGCPSDLDGSGTTDFGDAAVLLLEAGPCS